MAATAAQAQHPSTFDTPHETVHGETRRKAVKLSGYQLLEHALIVAIFYCEPGPQYLLEIGYFRHGRKGAPLALRFNQALYSKAKSKNSPQISVQDYFFADLIFKHAGQSTTYSARTKIGYDAYVGSEVIGEYLKPGTDTHTDLYIEARLKDGDMAVLQIQKNSRTFSEFLGMCRSFHP